MIHLDTNIVVAHLRGDHRVAERLASALPDVGLSMVVVAELLFGVEVSSRREENAVRLAELFGLVALIEFDRPCADAYAMVRAGQRRSGRSSGEADALIAATALAHKATVVTHNTRHFEGIEGLACEDWLSQP
ncbi:MAG: type II toxin-antitoxin system VapC family toxin [Phycisphaerales bacterium]|nr:type II toxin-antitoxin system VapC family toxin [Phycisphaerales bacterium]